MTTTRAATITLYRIVWTNPPTMSGMMSNEAWGSNLVKTDQTYDTYGAGFLSSILQNGLANSLAANLGMELRSSLNYSSR